MPIYRVAGIAGKLVRIGLDVVEDEIDGWYVDRIVAQNFTNQPARLVVRRTDTNAVLRDWILPSGFDGIRDVTDLSVAIRRRLGFGLDWPVP